MVTAPALTALGGAAELTDVPVFVVSQLVMNTVTGFNIHRGCLAIGERGAPLDWRALTARAHRLVILERLANADNVGAIFRNAAAFGVDAVLLGPDCTDPLYRKATRTSMAATLTIPFARVDVDADAIGANAAPWPEALRLLRTDGFHVMALSPWADAPPLRAVITSGLLRQAPDSSGPFRGTRPAKSRVAFVVGHEGEGLTREALEACDTVARIPMVPGHDSLNVATAVGIALYELFTIHHS